MNTLPAALVVTFCIALAAACGDSKSSGSTAGQGGAAAGEAASMAGATLGQLGAGADAGGNAGQGDAGATSTAGGNAAGGAGSDNAAGSGGAGIVLPADSTSFCDAFAARLCEFAETCQKFASCEGWGGYQNWVRECQDARASESGGYLQLDPEQAALCLETAQQEPCVGGGPLFNRPGVLAACSTVFAGTVAVNDECASADFASVFDECKAGYCDREGQAGRTCLGSCAPYLKDGSDCSGGGLCTPGSFCQDGQCGPPRGVGESCSSAVCESGLGCAGITPTCRERKPLGESCADSYDCEWPASCVKKLCADALDVDVPCRDSSACKDGLFCKLTGDSQVCAPRVAAAQPCDVNLDQCVAGFGCSWVEPHECVKAVGGAEESCGPSGCEAGLWCQYSAPFTGTCHERSALAGPCTDTAGCEDGLFCVGSPGKCGMAGGEGAPCAVFDEASCEGNLFCARDTLKCSKPRAKGQTCNPDEPLGACQVDLYCACFDALCPTIGSSHNSDDVCTSRLADDSACVNAYECKGGYCVTGKCASVPPVNTNCSR